MESLPQPSEASFTFKVDAVELCQKAPRLHTAEDIIRNTIKITEKFEDFSHRTKTAKSYIKGEIPGIITALHTAYQSHYALSLSVSDFIILIGQGLGAHIDKHAEKLRTNFVNHKGKEKIQVHRDEFVKGQQNDWSTAFGEFADEIKKRVKADVYGVIIDDTSVATPTTRIVSEITLMDAMKNYFAYEMVSSCGIPQITLEGTPEDWQKLKDKVQKLVEMNKDNCLELKWWLDQLVPVVDKICEAGISRKVDVEFWSRIYKYRGGSGGPTITGWITKFFPYLSTGVNSFDNDSVKTNKIPKQICEVPLTWNYFGTEISMKFSAGFLGAEFDAASHQVKSAHFWCVTYQE